MTFTLTALLKNITNEAEFISQEMKHVSYDEFKSDALLQRAIERSLEVIGEAAKHLESFGTSYSNIFWKELIEMKSALSHRYFDVDLKMIYDVCISKIPKLLTDYNSILN